MQVFYSTNRRKSVISRGARRPGKSHAETRRRGECTQSFKDFLCSLCSMCSLCLKFLRRTSSAIQKGFRLRNTFSAGQKGAQGRAPSRGRYPLTQYGISPFKQSVTSLVSLAPLPPSINQSVQICNFPGAYAPRLAKIRVRVDLRITNESRLRNYAFRITNYAFLTPR